MSLSIFVDALPYTEICSHYQNWFVNMQVSPLIPNIAYSSSLHWQLYCDKYPDERGVLVDWCKEEEPKTSIRLVSKCFSFMDSFGDVGIIFKKFLSKYLYRRNAFANIPFRFRPDFSEKGKYLFWSERTYRAESIFDNYVVVSQDEGHISFDAAVDKLHLAISHGNKDIFFNTGFADSIGHVHQRGDEYSKALSVGMAKLRSEINFYIEKNPEEEVLIVSDHGMSTIKSRIDLCLNEKFGSQSKKSYIAYSDSCVMCVWIYDEKLQKPIRNYLESRNEGHLLTGVEREYYRATNPKFGDYIYILKEGTCFSQNWFGKSFKKPSPYGSGMHGFWPDWSAKDQLASVILINGKRKLEERYSYRDAHCLIKKVMKKS